MPDSLWGKCPQEKSFFCSQEVKVQHKQFLENIEHSTSVFIINQSFAFHKTTQMSMPLADVQ